MRVVQRILIVIPPLILVAVTAFLVPAHIQVRGVRPALPQTSELRALLARADGPVSVSYLNTSTQVVPGGELGHTVVLAQWADGRLFMIDAGMDRAAAEKFSKLLETIAGAGPAVFHGSISELLGPDIERVTGVGFTHLHIDHSQGVVPFCQARGTGAKLYQTQWQKRLQNFNTEEGAELVRSSCLTEQVVDAEKAGGLSEIEGFPGLGIFALGGHTPGSTAFAVPVAGKLWIFSGDTANTKADLLTNTGKGFLYSYLMVPEDTGRTEKLRQWLAALDAEDDMQVIVSHDLTDIEANGLGRWSRSSP